MSDNTLKQNSIDQIRDIIVGEQLDGFKEQIQKLENSLKDLEQNINNALAEMKQQASHNKEEHHSQQSAIHKDLEKLNQTFSKKSSELLKQLENIKQEKIDKNEIAEMLLTIANSLKNQ